MPAPTWYQGVELITPHVVRILTPRGSGTGFLFLRPQSGTVLGIATAAHVIGQSHHWEEPIRIHHGASGKSALLRNADRAIFLEDEKDTAAIIFGADKLPLPDTPLALGPENAFLKVGNDIGWLGYPAVASGSLCFFGGRISAWNQGAYLVDGVAINGVSGGPAFHLVEAGPILMGVLSAYIPNRATGEVLPGLAVVRDVSQFHAVLKDFASVDEAKEGETPSSETPPPPPEDPKAEVPTRRAT